MSEVVFHRLDLEAVMAALERYANEELGVRPEVQEVILIGSLARGDWSVRSDADVVVLVDSSDSPGPFRGPAYAPRHRSVCRSMCSSTHRESGSSGGRAFGRRWSKGTGSMSGADTVRLLSASHARRPSAVDVPDAHRRVDQLLVREMQPGALAQIARIDVGLDAVISFIEP
jgi:Nucleotidyltransferase domain